MSSVITARWFELECKSIALYNFIGHLLSEKGYELDFYTLLSIPEIYFSW
jgi:hypothetical protein